MFIFIYLLLFFSGSLMTRNLSDLVTSNDIIPSSDYLQSALFIISEADESKWLNEYETILPLGAVPRSARVLHKEDGQILYVIVVMKKFFDEYIQASAAKKFIARTDFNLDSEQQSKETEAIFKLEADIKSQWVNLLIIFCYSSSFYLVFVGSFIKNKFW